jgi:hypothetical protein
MDMSYLKEMIALCATAITALQLYLYGDGQTITALFTLYGALFGVDVYGTIVQKAKEK